MKANQVRILSLTGIAAVLMSAASASFAGTVTWAENTPTSVVLTQGSPLVPAPTYSGLNGTDTLYAPNGFGNGGTANWNYVATASATFNYTVTWTPSVPGEQPPANAVLLINRYAANQTSASGSSNPGGPGSGTIGGSASSTSEAVVYAAVYVSGINSSASAAAGHSDLQLKGQVSLTSSLAQNGAVWTASFAIPCVATASTFGTINGLQGGGGDGASSSFKQVVAGASVTY